MQGLEHWDKCRKKVTRQWLQQFASCTVLCSCKCLFAMYSIPARRNFLYFALHRTSWRHSLLCPLQAQTTLSRHYGGRPLTYIVFYTLHSTLSHLLRTFVSTSRFTGNISLTQAEDMGILQTRNLYCFFKTCMHCTISVHSASSIYLFLSISLLTTPFLPPLLLPPPASHCTSAKSDRGSVQRSTTTANWNGEWCSWIVYIDLNIAWSLCVALLLIWPSLSQSFLFPQTKLTEKNNRIMETNNHMEQLLQLMAQKQGIRVEEAIRLDEGETYV